MELINVVNLKLEKLRLEYNDLKVKDRNGIYTHKAIMLNENLRGKIQILEEIIKENQIYNGGKTIESKT